MADQAEKVILEAEDQVTPEVGKANAALGSFENKAESSHGKVIRISDQTRSSVQRLIASLEKQADVYGKSGVDRLVAQRDQLLQRYGREPAAVDAITKSYQWMITEQQRVDKEANFAGVGEKIRQGLQNPLQSVQGLLAGMPGWVGVGVAALTGMAAAGFEAAKGLGEWGVRIRDVELRTGLSAKQVGEFGFAAEAVGQDVSVFERIMRGLTMAIEDTSAKGEVARQWLGRFGVDINAVRDGSADTAQVMVQIAEGLDKLPTVWDRNKAALDLFKRSGIEAIPVLMELSEHLKTAEAHRLGFSEAEVSRDAEYLGQVVEIERVWDRIWRKAKEATVWVVSGAPGPGADLPFGSKADEPNAPAFPGTAAARRAEALATPPAVDRALDAAVAGYVKMVNEALEASRKAEAKAREALEVKGRELAAFERRMDEKEMGPVEKIFSESKGLGWSPESRGRAQDAALIGASAALQKEEAAAAKEDSQVALKAAKESGREWEEVYKTTNKITAERVKDFLEEAKAAKQAAREVENIGVQSQRETLDREAKLAERMVGLSGATGVDAIRATYQIRIGLAERLAAVEQERIDKETDSGRKLEDQARARAALEKDASGAMEQAQMEQLEMLHKQSEEIKGTAAGLFHTLFTRPQDFGKQLGSTLKEAALKPVTEGLGTITANVLHPLIFGATGEGGVAGMFRGAFGGGRLNDVKLINGAMPVMVMNQGSGAGGQGPGGEGGFSLAPWAGAGRMAMTGLLAGGLAMGAGMPAVRGGEIIGGGSSTAGLIQLSSGLWARGREPGAMGQGPGGGVSLPTPWGGGGSGTAGGGFGISNVLRNFRSIDLGGLTRAQNHVFDEQGFATGETEPGKITGVSGLAGAGLTTGGMMLAQRGLLGPSRGTWTGVAEGAAGGAMIGMQMGGPLGAAIGGVAGFGIGVGEKIAGVESPEVEAQKLVKQIYGIDIPQSNGVIRQIVEMAQSQYGGSVSMTVRTPAVRDLLQLYAESTGQKSNLFLSQPHGVNLTEANGVLNQSAVYNNGTPYTYASNLPVLGPAGGGQIPTGNPFAGGVTVQVSAEQTANLWATGTAAAIAGGSRAVAASAVNGQAASASRISGANVMLSPDVLAV